MNQYSGRTLLERFNDHWIPEPFSGCWLWIGAANKQGYGHFGMGRKVLLAHRVSWLLKHESLPNLDICHHCDTPACVNPDHLFAGTRSDNLWDMIDKGRREYKLGGMDWPTVRQVTIKLKKLTCKNGHPKSGDNLYIKKNGLAQCKRCARERRKHKRELLRDKCV